MSDFEDDRSTVVVVVELVEPVLFSALNRFCLTDDACARSALVKGKFVCGANGDRKSLFKVELNTNVGVLTRRGVRLQAKVGFRGVRPGVTGINIKT